MSKVKNKIINKLGTRALIFVCFCLLFFIFSSNIAFAVNPITNPATNITSNSATLNGTDTGIGGVFPSTNANYWSFHYTTDSNFTSPTGTNLYCGVSDTNNTTCISGTQSVSYSLIGLTPNTTYYFRLVDYGILSSPSVPTYGSILSFTTLASSPTLTTNAATNITSNSATFNGTINPNGRNYDVTFIWSTNSTPTFSNSISWPAGSTSPASGSSNVNQTFTLVSGAAAPSTQYWYRIAAIPHGASSPIFYGNILSFTTLVAGSPVPTLTITQSVWEIFKKPDLATVISSSTCPSGSNPARCDYTANGLSAGDYRASLAITNSLNQTASTFQDFTVLAPVFQTHFECVNRSCQSVVGPGPNRCGSNSDCGSGGAAFHSECDPILRACVNKAGAGVSTCRTDPECAGSESTHLECQSNACVIRGGAGSKTCLTVGQGCAGRIQEINPTLAPSVNPFSLLRSGGTNPFGAFLAGLLPGALKFLEF